MKNLKRMLGLLLVAMVLSSIASAQIYDVTTNELKSKSFTQKQAKKQLTKILSDTNVYELDVIVNYDQNGSSRIWKDVGTPIRFTSNNFEGSLTIDAAVDKLIANSNVNYPSLSIEYTDWNKRKPKKVLITSKTNWLRIADKAYDPDDNSACIHIYSDTTYLCTFSFDEEYIWTVNSTKETWGGIQIQNPTYYLANKFYVKTLFRD